MSMLHQPAADSGKILDLLWTRVRQRGDLPGFSRVIGTIVAAMRGDNDRDFNMTKTVLADPALTQRVLRLANSPMYSVFGQNISTVSRAVVVLGTDSIGYLALGLKLVDGLTDVVNSQVTRAEMDRAVMAGHIGRHIAAAATTFDVEEAVVCAMLHSLGRMMVTFYLPERWAAIQRSIATELDEAAAVQAELGMGLDSIARLVAQRWGLPAPLIDSFQDTAPHLAQEPLDHASWLSAVSTLSARCASIVCTAPAGSQEAAEAVNRLATGYASMLGVEPEQLAGAVVDARAAAAEELLLAAPSLSCADTLPAKGRPALGKPADAAQILARGVADMRNVVDTASTAQLLTMALETVFKGLGFTRTVAFVRNPGEGRYAARLMFGDGVQELASRLAFDDAYQPDVFHAALANNKMIFIENPQDPSFANRLPRWWRDALPTAYSFMVLPLTVNRHPIGLIYGDWDRTLPRARINELEIGRLDQIRSLVVRAIEQHRQVDPVWGKAML
ncbi:MAG: HDOD domain-containing protein [Burkholderiaceae bacterium]